LSTHVLSFSHGSLEAHTVSFSRLMTAAVSAQQMTLRFSLGPVHVRGACSSPSGLPAWVSTWVAASHSVEVHTGWSCSRQAAEAPAPADSSAEEHRRAPAVRQTLTASSWE
jgi:hypothetical protein